MRSQTGDGGMSRCLIQLQTIINNNHIPHSITTLYTTYLQWLHTQLDMVVRVVLTDICYLTSAKSPDTMDYLSIENASKVLSLICVQGACIPDQVASLHTSATSAWRLYPSFSLLCNVQVCRSEEHARTHARTHTRTHAPSLGVYTCYVLKLSTF